jgi:hypothetical protein
MMRDAWRCAPTVADPAEAHHEHGSAGRDLRRVQHRADTGLDRAPDEAREIEWRVVGHLDRRCRVDDCELGERADAVAAVHALVVPRER